MANYKIISDRLNTFFTNNNISIGTSIPTTGTYSRGDIIVNVGPTSSIEPMWICNEGGSPGVWGLVGVGGNGGSGELVCMNETVTVDGPVNEVSLGDLAGLVTDKDKLTVHFNSTHLMQGVDFEISADKTKIVKLTEGSWNESGIAGSMFAFELLKNVETIENGNIVLESKLTSITNSVNVGVNVSEVEIGVDGLNKDDDTLLVFKNGVMMVEGVDYNISEDNTKIVSIGEVWNKDGLDDYCIAFVVFKEVMLYDGEDGSITMDVLGSDVKEVLNNLTETTLQHSEILANLDDTYATKDDIANIKPVDITGKQDITDNNLVTADKTIVGAINELFQNVDSGKQLIADAIGDNNITSDSTFNAMSEVIINNKETITTELERIKSLVNNINTKIQNDTDLKARLVEKLVKLGVDVSIDDEITHIFAVIEDLKIAKGDAVSANVKYGKTFTNATGNKITGTIPVDNTTLISPGFYNKTIAKCCYNNDVTIIGEPNLKPENIKSGYTIFGVTGTANCVPYIQGNSGGQKYISFEQSNYQIKGNTTAVVTQWTATDYGNLYLHVAGRYSQNYDTADTEVYFQLFINGTMIKESWKGLKGYYNTDQYDAVALSPDYFAPGDILTIKYCKKTTGDCYYDLYIYGSGNLITY